MRTGYREPSRFAYRLTFTARGPYDSDESTAMKLIEQAILEFKQGRSDKVYEVDLCEVGEGRYVVDFRYGRRGSNLRESSKTATPVGLAEAHRVFSALVASKVEKGYQYQGHSPAGGGASGVGQGPENDTSDRNSDSDDRGGEDPEEARTLGPADHSILDALREGVPS